MLKRKEGQDTLSRVLKLVTMDSLEGSGPPGNCPNLCFYAQVHVFPGDRVHLFQHIRNSVRVTVVGRAGSPWHATRVYKRVTHEQGSTVQTQTRFLRGIEMEGKLNKCHPASEG